MSFFVCATFALLLDRTGANSKCDRSNSWDLAFLGFDVLASEEALHRSKSSVNIQFSWFLVGLVVFAITFYLGLQESQVLVTGKGI
uniref:Uncharacterized protein n=1 Tax=Salix viminalis TaxID=40686 RepID=A0A6N2MIR6_SALVM